MAPRFNYLAPTGRNVEGTAAKTRLSAMSGLYHSAQELSLLQFSPSFRPIRHFSKLHASATTPRPPTSFFRAQLRRREFCDEVHFFSKQGT